MHIQLGFDTEKDSLEDLKKVCAILQEIIRRRENKLPISELDLCNVKYKEEKQQSLSQDEQSKTEQPKNKTKTAGGCRYVPYEDMADTMKTIYGKKRRY